ncbi:hypothetical protein KXD40_005438 [Peronospora effusa]|uniref:Uncharacterized protein n=1 Tax=Peronospora effusa TaxID=542832 RepID=A0A3M6VUA7_9STRA|nr:hypothetical protein DD238_000565 [Peronospora effusa]UIZ27428.1 hypothetical protein KXD40_005438 [Peronospora effusa]
MSSPAEMLKSVLVLQLEAVKTLVIEYYQQTEAYVQQFGHLPLSHDPMDAAHDARIALRTLPALAESCVVSEVILMATKNHCGGDMCATSADHLESFLTISRKDVKTVEDRVHALFVLDASLTHAQLKKEMQSRFEGKRGYDLLVEWLAVSCSYKDEMSKAFTELLLLMLKKNVPTMSFTTKTMIKSLTQYKKVMKGKKNKILLQVVVDQYREKINS